ncbi:MAG: GTP-binding protein [Planctomycetales bacterium]|nr:GTP-binding protein [Planctomycetales bacterium]
MKSQRQLAGLLLLILVIGLGYLLVTMPPQVTEQYRRAQEIGPRWAMAYLAIVGLGAALLAGASVWILVRVLWNTRRKVKRASQRAKNPSQLSREQRQRELHENLEASENFAGGDMVAAAVRDQVHSQVAQVEAKLAAEQLELVAFGTISSGKSSLLNALAGREIFRADPRGGTTRTAGEIAWPAGDKAILVDTPGLAEVEGESRAAAAAAHAKNADLVLFVVDGPLKAYEMDLLRQLCEMEKRVVICLNKQDWYSDDDRRLLLGQIAKQAAALIDTNDIVAVRSRSSLRERVRVLADGSEMSETVEQAADISPLAERLLAIVARDGRDLLLANLLLQSRGLVESAKAQARASLDSRADELITKYMWAAGGATAVNPLPLLDLAGGSAITVKMVLDLAHVYQQEIDANTIVELLAQLTKNLIGMLGVTAAAPAIGSLLGSMLKTVPGVGTVAGGLIQGLVQALLTRWIGKVFVAYFQKEMSVSSAGLAELARRKWEEVTRPDELRKLVQAGRTRLTEDEDTA